MSVASLSILNLSACPTITDAGLRGSVSSLPNLLQLDLASCASVTDDGLCSVVLLNKLQRLNISRCSITDVGISNIVGARVGLEDCGAALHLRLAGNNGINSVASACHQLLSLDLHNCYDVTDFGLSYIALLPQLRILNLSSCQSVSDEGVVRLAPLQRCLRELNLNKCWRITDIGLASVGVLDQLQHLLLSRCSITDAGIGCLMHLKHLAKQFLCGCDHITGSGFADLAAPFPDR